MSTWQSLRNLLGKNDMSILSQESLSEMAEKQRLTQELARRQAMQQAHSHSLASSLGALGTFPSLTTTTAVQPTQWASVTGGNATGLYINQDGKIYWNDSSLTTAPDIQVPKKSKGFVEDLRDEMKEWLKEHLYEEPRISMFEEDPTDEDIDNLKDYLQTL